MKVIVGLGNPGGKYESTRHNVGFEAVNRISCDYGIKVIKAAYKALVGDALVRGEKLMLVKPMTFMNLSGESAGLIKSFYKLKNEDFIIIYDDTSLPAGAVRVRESGSDGGHNGMKSIIAHLGGQNFPRIRIGIGEAPLGYDLADYVLSKFTPGEKSDIDSAIEQAADCVKLILKGAVNDAMNKYNRRNKPPEQKEEGAALK